MMDLRGQVLAHEELVRVAANAYAKAADDMAAKKHGYQLEQIKDREKLWLADHTQDGMVTADPAEFADLLALRDRAYTEYQTSVSKWEKTSSDFKGMMDQNQKFLTAMYGKEQDAQKARESLGALGNSVVQFLSGVVSAGVPLALSAF